MAMCIKVKFNFFHDAEDWFWDLAYVSMCSTTETQLQPKVKFKLFCLLSLEQKLMLQQELGKQQHVKENNLRALVT